MNVLSPRLSRCRSMFTPTIFCQPYPLVFVNYIRFWPKLLAGLADLLG